MHAGGQAGRGEQRETAGRGTTEECARTDRRRRGNHRPAPADCEARERGEQEQKQYGKSHVPS
jgi:hypothetical protein